MICLTVASALGAKKRMGGDWELSDFLPRWDGEPESDDALLARARALFDPPKKET